jgi:multimeric flavodoxin WrbA
MSTVLLMHIPGVVVSYVRCRRCGVCTREDDFATMVDTIRDAAALVCASPVHYGDMSERMRAFTDRLRRICTHERGRRHLEGKKTVIICVAGGSGGGAPSCVASLTNVLRTAGMDVMDAIPVRRQNLHNKGSQMEGTGQWLVRTGEDTSADISDTP